MTTVLFKQMGFANLAKTFLSTFVFLNGYIKSSSDRQKTMDKINCIFSKNWSNSDFCRAATICANSCSVHNGLIFRNTVKARKARVALRFCRGKVSGPFVVT